jgi:predicted dehydrogenase
MTDERRLTLGVIGAGAWAAFAHIPAFLRRPEIVPLIVNRRDPVQLEALRERFGFERATTDWREVIAARPDIVALTGPAHLRAEQALAALEAGCHILAEKPFTVEPADAWAIHRLARERGLHLVLCYTWNEMGISAAADRLIHEDGGIGEVEAVSVEMSTIVRDLLTIGATYLGDADVPLPRGATWSDPSISGGGYGQAQLTHALGLLLRLVPQLQPERVAAFTAGPGATVELHDALVVRFEGGVIASIGGASLPPGSYGNEHQLVVRVTGSRGQVMLDMGARRVVRARGEELVEAELSARDTLWSFDLVVDRLVDLVVGRTTDNPSPGDLGARVVEILDGMYRSAASGQIETISRD